MRGDLGSEQGEVHLYPVPVEVLYALPYPLRLAVVVQMLQVGKNCRLAFGNESLHYGDFVVGLGFPLHKGDRPHGTLADTGAQSVAIEVADHHGFAVDQLQRAFVASGDTITAAVAQIFVDLNDRSFHGKVLLPQKYGHKGF